MIVFGLLGVEATAILVFVGLVLLASLLYIKEDDDVIDDGFDVVGDGVSTSSFDDDVTTTTPAEVVVEGSVFNSVVLQI